MITPIKTLRSTGEGSIRKLSLSRFKPKLSSQVHFCPRFNNNTKKSIFKNKVFTASLKLPITIVIQQVTNYGVTEANLMETLMYIFKTMSDKDNKTLTLAWYPKVKNIVRPLKSVDLTKPLSKKSMINALKLQIG